MELFCKWCENSSSNDIPTITLYTTSLYEISKHLAVGHLIRMYIAITIIKMIIRHGGLAMSNCKYVDT